MNKIFNMNIIDREFFNRNKKLLLIAFIIVFGSMIVASAIGYFEAGDSYGEMSKIIEFAHENNIQPTDMNITSNDKSGLFYFIHNFTIDIMTMIGGVLFSIPSLMSVWSSSQMAGHFIGKDFLFGLVATAPHGIIENLGSVFALTIAFIITRREILIIKNRSFDGMKTDLKDILILFLLDLIFIAVAGFIEAYVTPGMVSTVFGI